MSQAVQRFQRNPIGRDFVVGDIHGCFDLLRAELGERHFDGERDRLFSVGDLIDRGTQSAEALGWLAKPWFHACRGNHEEMLLNSPRHEQAMLSWILLNGGEWWLELEPEVRQRYFSTLAALPLAMEVDSTLGTVGIVHADVPAWLSWQQFIEALAGDDAQACEWALWGRERATGHVTFGVEGIDRVVCGHTVIVSRQPRVVGNVWLVDTGAFVKSSRTKLTLLEFAELFVEPG